MKAIGYICCSVILAVYAVLLNGWAFAKLWAWFMVSTFSLPVLSIPQAIGLSLMISYATYQLQEKKEDEDSGALLIKTFFIATFKPLFAIGFGAIVKSFL